jgi:hypothetical protein
MAVLARGRRTLKPEAAVVWIDRAHAHTILIELDGRLIVDSAMVPTDDDARQQALLHVVEQLDDAPRVLVLGESAMRTRLEREYVALGGRPDRLVELR